MERKRGKEIRSSWGKWIWVRGLLLLPIALAFLIAVFFKALWDEGAKWALQEGFYFISEYCKAHIPDRESST